ncbi:uncharacterized protein [Elaeis guineensis]|uniref:uncharacterized protein isoform X1 n=1 Tax=Elaeis guineensis var. tenera TaxID=51953 RepID=UPI003C6CEEE3
MYAEAGLQYPFLQGSLPELAPPLLPPPTHHHYSHLPPLDTGLTNGGPYMGNMMDTSIISEYDLGGEGDLFKAPEPIIEEPLLPLHPVIAAMSIISEGDDVITETFKVGNMELVQTDHLLNDVFYECKKELLEKSAIKESFSEVLDAKIPAVRTEEDSSAEKIRLIAEGQLLRSVSTGNLTSIEWIGGSTSRPNFLDFQALDFEAVFGMRRAYSEGDIQNLDNNNTKFGSASAVRSSFEPLLTISDLKSEERKQKLSRYRKKKSERNFGRKIKYACRKALADSQPRVRGRFAKTEEFEVSRPSK